MSKPVVTTMLGPVRQQGGVEVFKASARWVGVEVFKASLHSDLQQPGHTADAQQSWDWAGAQGPAHPGLTVSDEDGES